MGDSILEGIVHVTASHRHTDYAQPEQHLDRRAVRRQHVAEPLIAGGCLVGAAAAQLDPFGLISSGRCSRTGLLAIAAKTGWSSIRTAQLS
jgi:hypothetical protein